ncbi:hypothetical protein [Glaciecola sp. 1036]|uniref:hypothetical protein n=1 Tax=Alteromonadaceae TaxID=72275 RepID=UPI003D040036
MAALKPEIDIGLAALCLHAAPQQVLSIDDIAEVCGCNRSYIWALERRAVKKALIFARRKELHLFLKD